jgi:hypothetical protein
MNGYVFAFAHCWSCGFGFTFDPDLVPSIPIDPRTNQPPDVEPVDGGYERAVKRPICASCVAQANANRSAAGRETIFVPAGTYPDEPC